MAIFASSPLAISWRPEAGSGKILQCEHVLIQDARHQSGEPLDSYIMVEKEDVLEAIGSFVAAYIAELPQAQNLPPAELQLAITKAFKVALQPCVF